MRRSGRPTTASARCSRSARTRAGGGSSSLGCRGTEATCSTSRREPGSSRRHCSSAAFESLDWTRAPRCSPAPGTGSTDASSWWRRPRRRCRSPHAAFDHLTFTYLLRYVDDPAATLRELARVVRPGGTIAMLEFAVPRGIWRPAWDAWVGVGLPLAGRLLSPGGARSGASSARRFARSTAHTPRRSCSRSGATPASPTSSASHLSLGGGLVIWGQRHASS